jgi:hypothetical protein
LHRLAFLLLGLFVGCAALRQSGKGFVADSAAERIWQEARYERVCVAVKGPAACAQMQAVLQAWKAENNTANEVQQLGMLPAQEKNRINALRNCVRQLPEKQCQPSLP